MVALHLRPCLELPHPNCLDGQVQDDVPGSSSYKPSPRSESQAPCLHAAGQDSNSITKRWMLEDSKMVHLKGLQYGVPTGCFCRRGSGGRNNRCLLAVPATTAQSGQARWISFYTGWFLPAAVACPTPTASGGTACSSPQILTSSHNKNYECCGKP